MDCKKPSPGTVRANCNKEVPLPTRGAQGYVLLVSGPARAIVLVWNTLHEVLHFKHNFKNL